MDASSEASAQTLAGIGAGPEPAHGLAASVHQWVYSERARRELLATGEAVRTRSVETRNELPRGCRPGYRRDLHHDARCAPGVLG